jgi:hypothetical protein
MSTRPVFYIYVKYLYVVPSDTAIHILLHICRILTKLRFYAVPTNPPTKLHNNNVSNCYYEIIFHILDMAHLLLIES